MIETLQPHEPSAKKLAGSGPARGSMVRTEGVVSQGAERMVRREIRPDHVCVLTFDRPGSAANIFDQRTLTQLGEELDFIADAPQIKGVVLTSAKPSIFIAGVDLNMMTQD